MRSRVPGVRAFSLSSPEAESRETSTSFRGVPSGLDASYECANLLAAKSQNVGKGEVINIGAGKNADQEGSPTDWRAHETYCAAARAARYPGRQFARESVARLGARNIARRRH